MKDFKLTEEEQQELEAIERGIEDGTLQSVPNLAAEIKRFQKIARHTLKMRNITITLSERDLYKLKAKAIEEGIPYQTLASSILHKATAR